MGTVETEAHRLTEFNRCSSCSLENNRTTTPAYLYTHFSANPEQRCCGVKAPTHTSSCDLWYYAL
jgi:hypothetical protein